MKKILFCTLLFVALNAVVCTANAQDNTSVIKSGKYEIVVKGHIDFVELSYEDNASSMGEKISSVLFAKETTMHDKISILTENCDFFMKCFNGEISIVSGMACNIHTKVFFREHNYPNWYISFSDCGKNRFDVQIEEESQTDEPFKLDIVSSGTRNNSKFWIGTSDVFDCPLMIGEPNCFDLKIENDGDYYMFIPRDEMLFFYVLSKTEASYINGHEYVDLGLPSGNLWATCNIGAVSPSEYGDYFAWAETKPKTNYGSRNYKYYLKDDVSYGEIYSKYMTLSEFGTADNKTRLDLLDDAASVNWGGSWRIPTKDEWVELSEYCEWTSCEQDGHSGFKVSSKSNGNSIFLPKPGWKEGNSFTVSNLGGWYWASTLLTSFEASCLEIFFDEIDPSYYHYRWHGISIRPVSSPIEDLSFPN